jgi:P-type E1-E2 ATPase
LEDPVKEGVPEAIQKIKAASIKVAMVTGDNPLTAVVNLYDVGML